MFDSLCNMRSQMFPPSASFTEKDVPSQPGQVFIVTGGNSGIGFELCKILYGTGATVYMSSRSKAKAEAAISSILSESTSQEVRGQIKFLQLDLNDLESVKQAAADFAQQEAKVDVLWNNAGTGANMVEVGAKTKQGFEAMIGMHCVATLLFTELLLPQLRASAATGSPGATRVVWTSSLLGETGSPPNGIDFDCLEDGTSDRVLNYGASKAGTWMLGREFARRHGNDGILSIVQNPGNLKAGSYAGTPAMTMFFINFLLHEPRLGAYTGLYAGLSSDLSMENNGAYVVPWGRIRPDQDCPRKDLVQALTSSEQGGLGSSARFWRWCEDQWKPFL